MNIKIMSNFDPPLNNPVFASSPNQQTHNHGDPSKESNQKIYLFWPLLCFYGLFLFELVYCAWYFLAHVILFISFKSRGEVVLPAPAVAADDLIPAGHQLLHRHRPELAQRLPARPEHQHHHHHHHHRHHFTWM